ncbi:MAG: hypothetical protein PHN69_05445 [Candidatus Pacebacteria bacterium]|nr:hypothetical protein [Candidatus Paceibacterota bacterium]
MNSIFCEGIFTSQGFLAIILLAVGIFLLTKDRKAERSKSSPKVYLLGVISLVLSVVMLVIYIYQITNVVVL